MGLCGCGGCLLRGCFCRCEKQWGGDEAADPHASGCDGRVVGCGVVGEPRAGGRAEAEADALGPSEEGRAGIVPSL